MGWIIGIVLVLVIGVTIISIWIDSGKSSAIGMSEEDYDEYWESYSRHH